MKSGPALTVAAVVLVCLLCASAAATEITLVGQVNDSYQFVADGEVFEVEDNELGVDLMVNHNGQKVRVVGTLAEKEGVRLIIVESFQLLEE